MEDILLVSKDNLSILHNKSSRKNKQKTIYTWTLERFQEKMELLVSVDVFPSSSTADKDSLFSLVKDNINTRDIFDFDYLPVERDFIVIAKKDDNNWWLRLIYRNRQWQEESFVHFNRDLFADKYVLIQTGEVRID